MDGDGDWRGPEEKMVGNWGRQGAKKNPRPQMELEGKMEELPWRSNG